MFRRGSVGMRFARRIVGLFQQQGGFTLVELLIVLIIIALLVGIVVPNTTGFLGRGREESFSGDRRNIQVSVDAYYTDTDLRTIIGGIGYSTFPTEYSRDGAPGVITRTTNVVISMPILVDKGYMRGLPASAAPASGGEVGHYVWIIDSSTGTVYGCSGGSSGGNSTWTVTSYNADCGYDGQYP